MLDSIDFIYHMTLKLIKNRIFGMKMSTFYHLLRNIIMDVITLLNLETNIVLPQ